MSYFIIYSAHPRTGWRCFQACYLGRDAVAAFQQIKGYEQRDPAAQKLQIQSNLKAFDRGREARISDKDTAANSFKP